MKLVSTAKGRTVLFITIAILLTTVGIAYNKLFAMDTVLFNTDSNCNIPKVGVDDMWNYIITTKLLP